MSVIPVREALTLLENENLVQNIPYRGFMVTGIVFDDFLEYSLIRNEMECLALRYGVAYLTDESLNKTKALQRELERIAEMLRVNVSVRHAVGLLCTYRYEP